MRSTTGLLVLALLPTSVAACAGPPTSSSAAPAADRDEGFGDFGYSDVYRYYGGPSAVSEENEVKRQQGRQPTQTK